MFGFSLTEILVVLVLGLVVLGPEKIPEVARTLGKVMREVRKASNLLRDTMMLEDPAPKPAAKPVVKTAPVADVADSSWDASAYLHKEAPGADMIFEPMSRPRRSREFRAEVLKVVKPPEAHRDVYLHVPFEETR